MQTNKPPANTNTGSLARLLNCLDELEFAMLAGVKTATLDSWRRRGKGPDYVRLGNNYLYPIPAVTSYLDNNIKVQRVNTAASSLI